MRIMHMSDLHIGKKLEGRERLLEQRAVLGEIAQIIERENVELILIAGDVFDTYIPSAKAKQLFFEYAKKFASNGRALVVISGNHDDADRLTSNLPLTEEQNIFISGSQTEVFNGSAAFAVKLTESGRGYLIFENAGGERVFINLLPYPSEYRFKEECTDGGYIDKMKEWLNCGRSNNLDNLPEITVAHIFTLGGEAAHSEREIELGGARAFPPALLPSSDYIALGHLHKFQRVTDKCYYSGAIMRYAFDESGSEKYVITFDLSGKEEGIKNFTKHPLKQGRELVRINAYSLEQAKSLIAQTNNAYIELTLHTDRPLGRLEYKELAGFDVLKIITVFDEEKETAASRKNLSYKDMFCAYYKHKFGAEPPKDLMELYLELMGAE